MIKNGKGLQMVCCLSYETVLRGRKDRMEMDKRILYGRLQTLRKISA